MHFNDLSVSETLRRQRVSNWNFNPKTLVDLSVSAQPFQGGTLTFGVLNVGDVFPDKAKYVDTAYATFGNAFVYGVADPNGIDGRSYYLRMSVKL
jgi:iron complex outermembrane recepter protein